MVRDRGKIDKAIIKETEQWKTGRE